MKTTLKKGFLIAGLVFGTVISTFPSSEAPAYAASQQGTIKASVLNVRASASVKSSIVMQLKKNQTVAVLEQKSGWAKIQSGSKTGWVNASYLTVKQAAAASLKTAKVNASSLNVRSTPALTGKIVLTLKKGSTVTVAKTQKDWSNISVSGKTGWVSSKYLTIQTAASAKPSAAPPKPAAPAAAPAKPVTKKVTASSLNIRTLPSTSGKVVTTVKKNDIVTVLKTQGTWLNIKTGKGLTGWAASQYLTDAGTAQNQNGQTGTPPPAAPSGKVTLLQTSNIRSGPGTSSPVISTLMGGTVLDAYEKSGDWQKVKLPNGAFGWIAGWLVDNGTNAGPVPGAPSGVLAGKTIVVDAGHGGYDPGTRGLFTLEKNLTLVSSQMLVKKLQNEGANVIYTRNGDTYPTLAARAALSNSSKADAFISIHYDSGGTSATGISTFYYSFARDGRLASTIHKDVLAAVALPDRKASYKNLQVLRDNKFPCILIELGFLSNPVQEKLITTNAYQEKATNGIVQGLKEYFNR